MPKPVVKIDFSLQSSIPSKLPEQVQDLITEVVGKIYVLL